MSKSPITNQVMNQIKDGKVRMHGDAYFALLSVCFGVAMASILLVASFAFNVALSGIQMPHRSPRPLLLLIVAILAIGGAVHLLQQRSMYVRKFPEWSIALGVLVFVACIGFVLSRTPLNNGLQRGPFRPLYDRPVQIERNLPPAL